MKHGILLFLFLSIAVACVHAQEYPTDYFAQPMTIAVNMAGDFAEIRSNHFHSGLDLRTDGKEGAKVYAPADGYVSRINISAWGGGKVLYITHPNGYKTVYMHLSAFCGTIGEYVRNYQYANKVYAFDVELPKDSIRVHKGDVVALSGNTGGSAGPHLHYEIRRAEDDQPINPLYFGLKYEDRVAPIIDNIKVYSATEHGYVGKGRREVTLAERKRKGKSYVTVKTDTVAVCGRFYTGIYTYDRMEPSARNRNGVESIDLYVDGVLFWHYNVGTFLFSETRAINAIIDYPQFRRTGEYYILTRHLRGNRNSFGHATNGTGYMEFADGGLHRLEYRVSDYKGNTTRRVFFVRGTAAQAATDSAGGDHAKRPISYYKRFTMLENGFRVVINPGTIYENDYIVHRVQRDAAGLTEQHTIGLERHALPPHEPILVAMPIPDKVDSETRDKLVIVCVDGKRCTACPTRIEGTTLCATSRSFGGFAVRLDTVAPTVKAVNFAEGKAFSGRQLTVKIGDDLSGVEKYECILNGEWALAEHDGKTSSLAVDATLMRRGLNSVTFRVTDAVGNSTEQTWIVEKR